MLIFLKIPFLLLTNLFIPQDGNYKYVILSYSDSTRNEHISISELKFLDDSRFYWSGFSIDEELNLLKNSTDTFSLLMTDSGINLMLKSDTILLLPNQSSNDFKFSYFDFCVEHYLQTDQYNRIEIKRMPDTTINYNGKDEIMLHYKTKSTVHLKHYEEDLLILKKNLLPFKLHRKYFSDPTPMHYGYDNNEVLLFWD